MKIPATTKPPYRVPLMADIAAAPWNGFKVASTFSGAGGSCLGYRMAGYRVVWANEFVPVAQASYRANAPDTHLDCRDIRSVQPGDVLKACGLREGELDLFDGSPPCQAFSTAGKREKGWGKGKRYEHGAVQCNETLFTEYIRLLRGLMPKVFIAENVSGLVKGTAKGYFKEILRDLKACGYRVEARLLDAQWLGVPQMRQRIIFQGVREDLGLGPAWPKPLPYRYSVRDALSPAIAAFRDCRGAFGKEGEISDRPAPAVMAGTAGNFWLAGRVMNDTSGKGGANGINSYSSGDVTDRPCPAIINGVNGLNSLHFSVQHDESGDYSQGDITDKPCPPGRSGRAGTMFIEGANGFNGHAASSDEQPMPTVQAGRPERVGPLDSPSACIQAGAGASTSSGFKHGTCMMPGERRKFTIAELKRVCAFPDDFVLIGSYAQQWERLGNSVPPVMMQHIAAAIRDGVLRRMKAS